MLKFLRTAVLIVLGAAVACFSAWRSFCGGAWWLAVVGALSAYAALLSGFFFGSADAWYKKGIRFVWDMALSTQRRASLSLVALVGITSYLGILAYHARPPDTAYLEFRVFHEKNLKDHWEVGDRVTLHSTTDGIDRSETVNDTGAAVFRALRVPTNIHYQLEAIRASPPFRYGDDLEVKELPKLHSIDTATIAAEKREPLPPTSTETALAAIPRPANYLLGVDERGDRSLQAENAPWGVPPADLVINRLGYVLGYDLERKQPRWVAYSIGPPEKTVRREQRFVADPAIAREKQASQSDYTGSGYDRGHMISPQDLFFKGPVVVHETSYMSTVTPQRHWLNTRLWKDLEDRVRRAVQSRQRLAFVIAGPLFMRPVGHPDFEFETIGEGRIPVPTHFFRIMAMERRDGGVEAFGLIAPNANGGDPELAHYSVPIREIEQKSGLKFFPLLNEQAADKIKTEVGRLW